MRTAAVNFFLAGVALTLSGSHAHASDHWWDEIERTGPYVGISGVFVKLLSFEELDPNGGVILYKETSGGVESYAGYRFGHWLSVEGNFEWTFQVVDVDNVSTGDSRPDGTYSLTAGPKVHLGRWANGEFYASSGVGFLNYLGDDTSFAARFGAGVEVHLTRHVGMRWGAVYLLPTGNLDKLDYVGSSIGFFYQQ